MTDGGEGTPGRVHSAETRNKISKKRKELGVAKGERNPINDNNVKPTKAKLWSPSAVYKVLKREKAAGNIKEII